MKKEIAEKLYKRLKELFNDLPKAGNGAYRGYIKVEVGNNLTEILKFLSKEEIEFKNLKKESIDQEITDLFRILPYTSSDKVSGYININVGKKIKELLDKITDNEIIPLINSTEKTQIDNIAITSLYSNSFFSPNSPIRKISEVCQSISQNGYNEQLLKAIPNVNLQNLEGITLLTQAVQKNNKEMVKYLINNCSADIDARNSDFTTPLHHAIAKNDIDMVQFLLDMKADPQAYAPEPDKINTPFAFALENNNDTIIKVFFKKIRENNTNDIEDIRELVDQFNKLDLFNEEKPEKNISSILAKIN